MFFKNLPILYTNRRYNQDNMISVANIYTTLYQLPYNRHIDYRVIIS